MPKLTSLLSGLIGRKFGQEFFTLKDRISALIKRILKGNISIDFPSAT
jgi:hypothetical protein